MKFAKATLAILSVLALQACSSSGDLTFAEIEALPETAVMPTVGSATYSGTASTTSTGDHAGVPYTYTRRADLSLDANFSASTIGATVSNIRVTEIDGGVTKNIAPQGVLTGSGEISGTTFNISASGQLTYAAEPPQNSTATIAGTFKGTDAAAIQGVYTDDDTVAAPFGLNKH